MAILKNANYTLQWDYIADMPWMHDEGFLYMEISVKAYDEFIVNPKCLIGYTSNGGSVPHGAFSNSDGFDALVKLRKCLSQDGTFDFYDLTEDEFEMTFESGGGSIKIELGLLYRIFKGQTQALDDGPVEVRIRLAAEYEAVQNLFFDLLDEVEALSLTPVTRTCLNKAFGDLDRNARIVPRLSPAEGSTP